MANPDRLNAPDIDKSEQEVLNKSFDKTYNVLAFENLAYNPQTNTMDRVQIGTGGGQFVTSTPLAVRLDDTTTSNVTYVGKASTGATTSAASWQIAKVDETSGLIITYADGNANFDNVWDNRASLGYS